MNLSRRVFLWCVFFIGLSAGPALAQSGVEDPPTREETELEESAAGMPFGSQVGAPKMRILNKMLWGEKFTDQTGIFAAGWLAQGITGNPANPSDGFNGPLLVTDLANQYEMNQLYLYLEKPVDMEAKRITVGARCDLCYGTDAYLLRTLGLDSSICSPEASRFYQLAIPQLYVEFGVPIKKGLRVQFGKWYNLLFFESGLAPYCFFYSKALSLNRNPATHTGVLFNYQITDQLRTAQGLHRGTATWEDNNHQLGYTGNLAWNSKDKKTYLYFAINLGPEQDEDGKIWSHFKAGPGEQLNRTLYTLLADFQLTDHLRYIIAHNYFNQQGSVYLDTPNLDGCSLVQYCFYKVNKQFELGGRIEVLRDDGWIATGYRTENATPAGVYTNLTFGVNYKPGKHITWRPEVRWDWINRDDPGATPPFNAGKSSHQFTFGTDVVILF